MAQRFLPTVVAAAALAMAGCGGSSTHTTKTTSDTSSSAATSHATFLSQLDSACGRANNDFSAANSHNGRVAVVAHYLEIFHSLPAPAHLRTLYARYLAVLDQELIDLKQGNSAGLFRLAHTKARPLAKQLGATGCIPSS